MSVPKIIHYCWFGGNPKPKLAEKCIKSWKKFCPDYQIIEWNEENSLREPFYALVNASIRFEHRRWSLGVWGCNLTETDYNVFYFKSIGNEFVQRGRPRSFGITLTLNID